MAIKTIGLSFKNNEDDRKLYEWIYTHSNVSGFIKDILREAMSERKIIVDKNTIYDNDDNDLIDF
ncbi:MAG: hypothetical protein J6D47_19810 [Peptostreptococcaceae bacterium]|nr:hypothetical protein [Peptostreptococcaceae bacterium]